jgi:hypothetical protein
MKEIKFVLSLMTPRVWAVLLVLAVLALAAGAYVGYSVADGLAQIAAGKVEGERAAERLAAVQERLTHSHALREANEATAAIEKQWKDDLGDVAEYHKEEMDDAKNKIDALRADVLTGAVRLSIAVTKAGTAASHCPASGDSSAASGDQETRAELVPQAAYDLIGIAADGDDAVRDLNACIDAYHAIERKQAIP